MPGASIHASQRVNTKTLNTLVGRTYLVTAVALLQEKEDPNFQQGIDEMLKKINDKIIRGRVRPVWHWMLFRGPLGE